MANPWDEALFQEVLNVIPPEWESTLGVAQAARMTVQKVMHGLRTLEQRGCIERQQAFDETARAYRSFWRRLEDSDHPVPPPSVEREPPPIALTPEDYAWMAHYRQKWELRQARLTQCRLKMTR